ncbi:ecto-ADP-ribosyltransferase 5-like [Spea bombifrons]|uniref:ecto-ADP-ribosyltransferase 5-like n=1 Tax=Spea bombifrons TaxID=233779 RepID=UPI00234ACB43|nr:ecto-ADP-ribosyltransferase 5-like [Spea bombifrons]
MTFLLSCISLVAFAVILNKQGECQRVQLNMYKDSFDDQYFGCIEDMESILPELLKNERNENEYLNGAWESAANIWQSKKSSLKALPKDFRDEHGIAILTYTNISSPVYKQLNQGIREYGVAPRNFKYHSLHFYLTRAMTLLRSSCNGEPLYTYRGTSKIQFEPPVGLEQNIRLSQFSSSSTDIKEAQKFGNASFFRITTCYGVDIQSFSYFPSQKEVLIPVDEVFRVTSYAKDGNKFILTGTNQRCSFYNCDYLGGTKREVCTYNSASVTHLFPGPLTLTLLIGLVITVTTIPA